MIHSTFPMLDADRLQAEIENRLDGQPVNLNYLDSCESTNIECMQLADHASVVVAEHQTAGRGRRGKNWHSPLTQNIYCSIGVNKMIQAEYLGLISLQVGVCIAEVLHRRGFTAVSLKWPNDILLRGKKLGGVLIETRVNASNDFFLVIGIGLNIRLDDSALTSIDQPAISLAEVSDDAVDRQHLLCELISEVIKSTMALEIKSNGNLLEQFSHFDNFRGKHVQVKTQNEIISGIYQGIQSTGHLQIKTEHGIQTFSAAEISLREIPCVAD